MCIFLNNSDPAQSFLVKEGGGLTCVLLGDKICNNYVVVMCEKQNGFPYSHIDNFYTTTLYALDM